jgi:CRISPR-associated endonuclease Csn1
MRIPPAPGQVAYVLGLDLGANSLGWAAITQAEGIENRILGCGVRVFEAGVRGSLEQGREKSRAGQRRTARLQRRRTDRRRRRMGKVYCTLAASGLLPPATSLRERVAELQKLDSELSAKHADHVKLPYTLRRKALDERLDAFEIGRAIFHLAQRRGFQSNRKERRAATEDDDWGRVKDGISEVSRTMAATRARTLGEYFSSLDPSEIRIRGCYTHREMYKAEFDRIWATQQVHHLSLLTDEARKAIFNAIFDQRPLREQKELIGNCECVPGERRAPTHRPFAQRFRLLQEVNNLRIGDRPPDAEERRIIIERLENGDLPIGELKGLLRLRGSGVNLDAGGKKVLIGDRTTHELRRAFLNHWDRMTQEERLEAIEDLAGNMPEQELRAKAGRRWGLNGVQMDDYVSTNLPDEGKYIRFSEKALEALIPYMETGLSTTEAVEKAMFRDINYKTAVQPNLPPVATQLPEIRNPAVVRALTELRKVGNELIRRFGEPMEIHIELARDLKASRTEREKTWKRNEAQRQLRESTAAKILKECIGVNPRRREIDRWRLMEECGGCCPYTGRMINAANLFSGEVQVEHIIPWSRSLDDSFSNLTLCFASENATKNNRAPREAYEGSEEWDKILQRVEHFQGEFRNVKLRRFKMTAEEVAKLLDDFSSRQLNDTRYASKLAARYVSCLYGGTSDDNQKKRVYVTAGQVTAKLRRLWQIEGLLGASEQKTRDDHRYHAVDAVVVALTSDAVIRRLSQESARVVESGQRRKRTFAPPWPTLRADVEKALAEIVVSWRVDHKVGGMMHDENAVGEIKHPGTGQATGVRRKLVHLLSRGEVESIVDEEIKARVKLARDLNGGDLRKLVGKVSMKSGVPIRKVRIAIADKSRRIAGGVRERRVVGGEFHHFEIIRRQVKRGPKIDHVPISIHDAMDRVRRKVSVIERGRDGAEFVCPLSKRDTFEITRDDGRKELVVVRTLERPVIGFTRINDARPISKENGNRERIAPRVFFGKMKARKIVVSPSGLVFAADGMRRTARSAEGHK